MSAVHNRSGKNEVKIKNLSISYVFFSQTIDKHKKTNHKIIVKNLDISFYTICFEWTMKNAKSQKAPRIFSDIFVWT